MNEGIWVTSSHLSIQAIQKEELDVVEEGAKRDDGKRRWILGTIGKSET